MFTNVNFVRTMGIQGLFSELQSTYSLTSDELGIPKSVLDNPSTLIPVSVLNDYYRELELKTGDPDAVLNLVSQLSLERLGSLGRWFLSGHDLASAIRRINFGITCIQSGAILAGEMAGPLAKWTYKNDSIDSDNKVHEGIRVVNFMLRTLKHYLGENYSPDRVCLPGNRRNHAKYQAYFGCEVEWNHDQAEIWLPNKMRLQGNKVPSVEASKLAMSFSDLDRFLNMPDPNDYAKVLYETINYSRHFGLPTLERVSALLGLSEQQLQRRLHNLGLNFSYVVGFVLSGEAVIQITAGISVEQVAKNLGYNNVTSFGRMFKKYRGVTPAQYRRNVITAY
ncbi:AraC family transcriptional regulator [Vibrio hippocampi]|uniref:HTH araC/xylS-type domain-containing protein n=1 Tax=Vibrio hippocampi TaxID=654686 RepID=A0ABM8ZMP1_9VIBR|nr:AraC family transcriptional regulator [Vibrio hippocampi]CAH0528966.1 hypothetical protein VHP8226_02982 [Vibrio hippocampi]